MVVDASVLMRPQRSRSSAFGWGSSAAFSPGGERQEETPAERSARVHYLAALVKDGGYAVHAGRLATALLEWDPRRSNPKQSAEVADRRRAYMREYMRRRRAMGGSGDRSGEVLAAGAT